MARSVPEPYQSSKPSAADLAIAAAQLCYLKYGDEDAARLSRQISHIVGRPVLVVNLDLLPNKPDMHRDDKLSSQQANQHAAILKSLERKAFPERNGFPKSWKWQESGQIHSVNSTSWRVLTVRKTKLPSRLSGKYWVKAAILTTADKKWNNRELWSRIAGIPPEQIEHVPNGDAVRAYNLGHELGHVLQLCPKRLVPDAPWQWETERDADRASFSGLKLLVHRRTLLESAKKPSARKLEREKLGARKAEFDETMKAVIHGRALSGFRASFPAYWSALNLNGHENVAYRESLLCNYELRLRVYAEMTGAEPLGSSKNLQKTIDLWKGFWAKGEKLLPILQKAFESDWDWGNYNDIDKSIPALNRILRRGDITDPLAARNAELVIEAATYFRPSLKMVLAERPVAGPNAAVQVLTC